MADNVNVPTLAVGTPVASDEVGGTQYQRIKLDAGAEGASAPVTSATPLPVTLPAAQVPPANTGYSTDAKLDTVVTALTNLLSELQDKADLTDTQPVSLASVPSHAVTEADGANVTIGATTDAAVVTDANGSLSAKLRGLIKLLVDKITVKLDAGSNNIGSVDAPTATPTAYNLTLTDANTEYSQALPANCRGFEFQARSESLLRYAFATGKVATPTAPWLTLKAGDAYASPQLNQAASPSTLYLASPTAGTVVEILAWT